MASYLRKVDLPGEMRVYDARLGGKVVTYPDGSKTFGDDWNALAHIIEDYAPNVIAISNIFPSKLMVPLKPRALPSGCDLRL